MSLIIARLSFEGAVFAYAFNSFRFVLKPGILTVGLEKKRPAWRIHFEIMIVSSWVLTVHGSTCFATSFICSRFARGNRITGLVVGDALVEGEALASGGVSSIVDGCSSITASFFALGARFAFGASTGEGVSETAAGGTQIFADDEGLADDSSE